MKEDDAISRQAAIDIIESWLSCDDYNEAERHIMRATESILYDLPSVNLQEPKTRWIPVSERLPDIGQRVLVTTETLDNGKMVTGTYYDRYGFVCGNVLAWMPLPKPFEPQESEEV